MMWHSHYISLLSHVRSRLTVTMVEGAKLNLCYNDGPCTEGESMRSFPIACALSPQAWIVMGVVHGEGVCQEKSFLEGGWERGAGSAFVSVLQRRGRYFELFLIPTFPSSSSSFCFSSLCSYFGGWIRYGLRLPACQMFWISLALIQGYCS